MRPKEVTVSENNSWGAGVVDPPVEATTLGEKLLNLGPILKCSSWIWNIIIATWNVHKILLHVAEEIETASKCINHFILRLW
jgi:hypothetical protein